MVIKSNFSDTILFTGSIPQRKSMAAPLPNTKASVRTEITEYADGKNCFSSGIKRGKMDKIFESLGKELSTCPDKPSLVKALSAKYRAEVDKICAE
jgi:hypothetical protein